MSSIPKSESETWIFGYGSLIWNPDFEFDRYEIAVLSGYGRYFWQGSWTARGSKLSPGRVATITEEANAQVWGAAIRVCTKSRAKTAAYLAERESGYEVVKCAVRSVSGERIDAKVYVARETNSQYMGPAGTPLHAAREILRSSGTTGRCLDYLVNLIASLRVAVPAPHQACDKHILELEEAVRWTLYHQTLRHARLLGYCRGDNCLQSCGAEIRMPDKCRVLRGELACGSDERNSAAADTQLIVALNCGPVHALRSRG